MAAYEKGTCDTASASYACDTTGSVTLVNGLAEGYTDTTRNGKKVWFVSAHVKGYVVPVDGNTSPQSVTIGLVYDAQPGAALPAVTDIFSASSAVSFRNLSYSSRFTMLSAKTFVIGGLDTTVDQTYSQTPNVKLISMYRTWGFQTIYKGADATLGSIARGALYLVTVGSVAAGVGATAVLAVRCRYCLD